MAADSNAIDQALVGKLLADGTLMATMSGGVYWELAPEGADKFVLVALSSEHDGFVMQQDDPAMEDAIYLVKAVARSTTGADVKTASARIHTLLHRGTLTPTGYNLMLMQREERVRYTEVDDADTPATTWHHRGGLYRIVCQPT